MSDTGLDKKEIFNRLQRYFDIIDKAESPEELDCETKKYHKRRGR